MAGVRITKASAPKLSLPKTSVPKPKTPKPMSMTTKAPSSSSMSAYTSSSKPQNGLKGAIAKNQLAQMNQANLAQSV